MASRKDMSEGPPDLLQLLPRNTSSMEHVDILRELSSLNPKIRNPSTSTPLNSEDLIPKLSISGVEFRVSGFLNSQHGAMGLFRRSVSELHHLFAGEGHILGFEAWGFVAVGLGVRPSAWEEC